MALTVPVTPNTKAPVPLQGYQKATDISGGFDTLGRGITGVAEQLRENQDKRQATDMDLAFVQQANDDADHLDAMEKAADPGAPGFTKQVDAEFSARHQDLVNKFKAEKFSQDNLDKLEVRLAAHRGGLINAGRNFQGEAYHQLVNNKANAYQDSTNELVRRDPTSADHVYEMNHNFATSMVDLTADERQKLEDSLNTSASHAAAATEAHDHPEDFIKNTGGVVPETKLDAKLSAVGTRSLVGVIGALESGNRDHYANGQPVVSSAGAHYRMQVLPGTALAPGFGIKGAVDNSPAEYNRVGEALVPALLQKYNGSVDKVLAAYNWDTSGGVSKVDKLVAKYGDNWRMHLPPETRKYVTNGLKLLGPQTAEAPNATASDSIGGSAVMGFPTVKANDPNVEVNNWDVRADGSQKGMGFLGLLRRPDGGVSSEISVGVNIGGKETEIPTMVPTLNKAELTYLMTTDPSKLDLKKGVGKGILAKAETHAQERIAAGKSPFAQADESPTSGPTHEVASRYRFLSPEQIYSYQDQAQRQIDREHQVVEAGEVAKHAAYINDLHNKIADGVAGQVDLDNAYRSGQITDYNERKSLQDQLNVKNKTNANLDFFNSAVQTPGFHWNKYDKPQNDAIEAGVQELAKTPNAQGRPIGPMIAAFGIWNKTGILADSGAAALRGGLVDTNPKTVQEAVNVAGNMLRKDPHAFTAVAGGSEIETAALTYNHYTNDLNMSPDMTAQKIAQENTPEYKSKIKVGQPEYDAFHVKVMKEGISSAKVFGGGWFSSTPGFRNNTARQEADQTYAELATAQLKAGKDEGTAKAVAGEQMKKFYGVTRGGFVTKYPPELSYPPINGSIDYVYKEAVATVKAATGIDLTKEAVTPDTLTPTVVGEGGPSAGGSAAYDGTDNIRLIPVPRVTNADFQAGRPARYSILFVHTIDGQPVTDMVKGLFHADGAAARADPGFAAERHRAITEQRGVDAGLTEMRSQMGSGF